jgi:hypothetical protein
MAIAACKEGFEHSGPYQGMISIAACIRRLSAASFLTLLYRVCLALEHEDESGHAYGSTVDSAYIGKASKTQLGYCILR